MTLNVYFAAKKNQERMFKEESQRPEKHPAYKVRSHFAQQQLKVKCLERKDIWRKEVLARIKYSRDLMHPTAYTTKVVALCLDWRETQMKIVLTTCHEEKQSIWLNYRY